MERKIRVTVWNEYIHERQEEGVRAIYPEGIHGCIRDFLADAGYDVRTATLDMPEHGLTQDVLENTDVLIWWGHMGHQLVSDEIVERVFHRVTDYGMGLICLHSAHHSKIFRKLTGSTANLLWGDEQKEIVWNMLPQHPIAAGIPEHFEIESEEMYGEPFTIAQPDELIFGSWFRHGNIFRSGVTYYRGLGKIFYFQPGHEYCRSFYNENVRKIIKNAVEWCAPQENFTCRYPNCCPHFKEYLD